MILCLSSFSVLLILLCTLWSLLTVVGSNYHCCCHHCYCCHMHAFIMYAICIATAIVIVYAVKENLPSVFFFLSSSLLLKNLLTFFAKLALDTGIRRIYGTYPEFSDWKLKKILTNYFRWLIFSAYTVASNSLKMYSKQ